MRAQYSIMAGAALLALVACQQLGLEVYGMPKVARPGEVKDIVIQDNVSSALITVYPGEEIRWINKLHGDARVILSVEGQLSCRNGFEAKGMNEYQYTAELGVNDTARLCFKSQEDVQYMVRADPDLADEERNTSGTINVEGR